MLAALIRKPGLNVVALALSVLPWHAAAGESDGGSVGAKTARTESSVVAQRLPAAKNPGADARKRDAARQESAKDDWPTDDFGRPLRECDVPWDLVPSK